MWSKQQNSLDQTPSRDQQLFAGEADPLKNQIDLSQEVFVDKTKPLPSQTSVIRINDEENGDGWIQAGSHRSQNLRTNRVSQPSQLESPESERSGDRNFDLPERYTLSKTVKNNNFINKDAATEAKKRSRSPPGKKTPQEGGYSFPAKQRLAMEEEGNAQVVKTVQMVVKHQGSSGSEGRPINAKKSSNLVQSDELSNIDSEINQRAVVRGLNYSSEENQPLSFRVPQDPLNAGENQQEEDEQERVKKFIVF